MPDWVFTKKTNSLGCNSQHESGHKKPREFPSGLCSEIEQVCRYILGLFNVRLPVFEYGVIDAQLFKAPVNKPSGDFESPGDQ